jgi:uncharacterized SAM-binding protein YcdF (DUF218 family)
MNEILENIQILGPIFAFFWALTIAFVLLRPQSYLNSFLLMASLFFTMLFASGFFPGSGQAYFLLACFLLVMLAIFLVPALLILNGVQMIRRESFSAAHVLSLALGIFVGIGEIATVIYVFSLSDFIQLNGAHLWFMLLSFSVFYFSFLVLSFVLYTVFIQIMPHRMNFNYIIIHGCGLIDGERISKLLSNRVDKAIEVYNRCKTKPVIVPSGRKGADEKISEAEAMKRYLLEHGIPESDILLEDQSTTTEENLINSRDIIDRRLGKKKTALVSSNYHIYRCLRLARQVGFRCTGIGAKVALYYWPSALIREFVAVFVTPGFLIIALIGYVLFLSPLLFLLL